MIDPPTKEQFDRFWEAQNGVRGLFVMDEVAELPEPVALGVYGRGLELGFPMGVGCRYFSVPQCLLLLRMAGMASAENDMYLHANLEVVRLEAG
jgi:hypothetical protein